jgi:hypothetical protein
MSASPRDSGSGWLGEGGGGRHTGSVPASGPRNTRVLSAYPALAQTGSMSAYGGQKSTQSPLNNTLTGALGPYSLPSAPAYPSLTANYRPLPPMRPLETLARRGRPRWGLRFMLLLIVAGGGMYFLRPYISWIDNRVTPVENRLREVATQYGFGDLVARVLGKRDAKPVAVAPAAPAAPVAVERAAAAAPRAAAVAAKAPVARPDVQPISPRASRAAAARAAGFARAGAAGRPAAVKQAAVYRARSKSAAAARWRAAIARRRMALAANTRRFREAPMPSDEEITSAPRPAPAAAVAAAAPAAAAEVPEAPAPKAAAEPPVEKGPPPRSTATLVKEAAGSGDELERLMAGAVSEKPAATGRRGDRAMAEIDRKIADVEKGGVQPGGARLRAAAAASSAPALSTGDIKTVMAGVQKQMNTCFRQHGKAGQADVKVEVAPDGSVPGALIRGEFAGTPTGACVQSKIKEATFPASSGLRFDYRLSVR